MGGVPFMTWKLPASAEDNNYDDTDSDSTFFEPEEKSLSSNKSGDSYAHSNSSDLIYGDVAKMEKCNENLNFCVNNEDANLKRLQDSTARGTVNEYYNVKLYSNQESLRNFFHTKEILKNTVGNEIKHVINSDGYHMMNNDIKKIEINDNLSDIVLNSFSAGEGYANNTEDIVYTETPEAKENSDYHNNYKNQNTDEDDSMKSIMTGLVSLLQNNNVREDDNTYHSHSINTENSNITGSSFEQREDISSESVCYNLHMSFNDRLVMEHDESIAVVSAGDNFFSVPNNSAEMNTENYDNILMNDDNMLKQIDNDLNCSRLSDFSIRSEESDLPPPPPPLVNSDDLLLSNFDSETLNAYDQNINFMLENDRFQEILKYQDIPEGIRTTTEASGNVWTSTTANCYSVPKRKWPNPKQWSKLMKLKSVKSCKSAERVLPQRNCYSMLSRNNRKVCNKEDFVELSVEKRKGKKLKVNIQRQQRSPSDSYMTRSASQRRQRRQPQTMERLENKHTFQSVEEMKCLEKVKTALQTLSFRIKQWTSGQDEHPPTRDEALSMLQYVERVHANLNDKAKKCEKRRIKTHFLQVTKDAEQLYFRIQNAIEEADRLYQMEQEQILEMVDDCSETNLSDCINEMDDTSRMQLERSSASWLTNIEQSQYINENHIIERKEQWATSEYDEVKSDKYCQKDVSLTALNNKVLTTKKSILKSTFKGTENNKKRQKRLSFSDVIHYIADEDVYMNSSSDDFSDVVKTMNKDSYHTKANTNNKCFVASSIELSTNDDICVTNNNTIQKKVIIDNSDDTYMTPQTSTYRQQTEDDLKTQVNVKLFNQKLNAEDRNGCTMNDNQYYQQGQNKQHKNYLPDSCYQNNNYTYMKNNNMVSNETYMTASNDNGGCINHNKQRRHTFAAVKMEVQNDLYTKTVYQQESAENEMNKLCTQVTSNKNNMYIMSTDCNNTNNGGGGVIASDNAGRNGSTCSSNVRVSPIKRRGSKKKLNPSHTGRKPNNINVPEIGHNNNNNKKATSTQYLTEGSLSNVEFVKSMDELESRQCISNFTIKSGTHSKSLNGRKTAANEPGKHGMVACVSPEKKQTNSYGNLQMENTDKNCCEINQESVEMDETRTLNCELEHLTLTNMKKRGKINQFKHALIFNDSSLKPKSSVVNSDICSEDANPSNNKIDRIVNKNGGKQKVMCNQGAEKNKLTKRMPLFGTQKIKVTKGNENYSTSNDKQTILNSQVSDKNEHIQIADNSAAKQKPVNSNFLENKEKSYQNLNCQKEVLEQFKNISISDGSQESVSQCQSAFTNEFTFNDDVYSDSGDGEQNNFDWRLITIMDVKRVRIKHKSEYIPISEVIFDSDELFKDLNVW